MLVRFDLAASVELTSDFLLSILLCIVAVTGLPDPRPNHAVAMVRFGIECLSQFQRILPELEILLGPDTADLAMRVGIHSGPVTAGVLRGERSRCRLKPM